MVIEKIQELEALKAKTAELSAIVDKERKEELASLPAKYGYGSVEEFIEAVKEAAVKPRKTRQPKAAKVKGAKRSRVKITDEIKQQVIDMVNAGKTGVEIQAAVGISVPSIQNIKKEAGMVKTRKAE